MIARHIAHAIDTPASKSSCKPIGPGGDGSGAAITPQAIRRVSLMVPAG